MDVDVFCGRMGNSLILLARLLLAIVLRIAVSCDKTRFFIQQKRFTSLLQFFVCSPRILKLTKEMSKLIDESEEVTIYYCFIINKF